MGWMKVFYNTCLPVGDDIESGRPCSIIGFDDRTGEITHKEDYNLENVKLSDYDIEHLARAFLPAMEEFYATEEGQKSFQEWQRKEGANLKPINYHKPKKKRKKR